MDFFKRKKTPEKKETKPRTMQEIAVERVLTAEGWRRRMQKKVKKG